MFHKYSALFLNKVPSLVKINKMDTETSTTRSSNHNLLGLRTGSAQSRSSHCMVVSHSLLLLAVDTLPLKDSNRGLMIMLNWRSTVKENTSIDTRVKLKFILVTWAIRRSSVKWFIQICSPIHSVPWFGRTHQTTTSSKKRKNSSSFFVFYNTVHSDSVKRHNCSGTQLTHSHTNQP